MADDFFDSSEMQSLFHLLGNGEKVVFSKQEITQACEQILINFQTLCTTNGSWKIFNDYSLQNYKCDFTQLLADSGINLEEIPSYHLDLDLWFELVKTISIFIDNNYHQLLIINEPAINTIIKAIKLLNQAWNLKLQVNQ